MQESRSGTGLHAPAFLVATGAALVGASAWGVIAYVTEYELGYIAWGIGLLIGLAAVKSGGRGAATATTCAALTIAAILAGKLLGTHLLVEKELSSAKEDYFPRTLYDELVVDAADFSTLADRSPEELRAFMVTHAYGEFGNPQQVPDGALADFERYSLPALERLSTDGPNFGEWQELSYQEFRAGFDSEFDLAGAVVEELNAIDLIFAILAVSTAFSIINRAGRDQDPSQVLQMPADDEDQPRRAA